MYINVDLKDAPESYEGSIAPQIMFDTIAENQAFDRVLVTSFYKEQIVRFNKIAQGSSHNHMLTNYRSIFKISFIRW